MRRPSSLLCRGALALLGTLVASPAWGAPIAVLGSRSASASGVTTLRVPATGNLQVPVVEGAYATVAVAISGDDHQVSRMTWIGEEPVSFSISLVRQVGRLADNDPAVSCLSELWALKLDQIRSGFVEVTLGPRPGAAAAPAPAVAATVVLFSNVGATSLGGACCEDASNDGAGTSIISKTMIGTRRGDALVNTVCTQWTGAAPGTPRPDPVNDPELVPRSYEILTGPNLQHFAGTSPGADTDSPEGSYRHLRWLQSGSRTWSLTGMMLHATRVPAYPLDAGSPPPPDASPPPPDTSPPLPETAPALPDTSAAPPDTSLPPRDTAAPSPDPTSPPSDAASPPDSGAVVPPPPGDAGGEDRRGQDPVLPLPAPDLEAGLEGPRHIEYQVGCSCLVGARQGLAPGAPTVASLVLAVVVTAGGWRRRRRH